MVERKKKFNSLKWRIEVGIEDLVLYTKRDEEPQWSLESITSLGVELPEIPVSNGKRPKDSPGEKQPPRTQPAVKSTVEKIESRNAASS